eukprot:TRINITY_DN228_c0_g1_i11.p1 TRINITY_DN228_c0_g1~~TRINITY_DN228_c0_g1_i11.p1  ORF type:complete len:329 (+),score=-1.86 TRINITY_DN228_c0_g1_i11:140-1126(+)
MTSLLLLICLAFVPHALGDPLCNGQAYDSSTYTCTINDRGQSVLCPKGYSSCGTACYNPSAYCCQNGELRQSGQCSVTTSMSSRSTSVSPSTVPTNPGTCNGQAYDPNLYSCPTNDQGLPVLCPKGYGACGSACYSPTAYCCQNGLRPAGQCSSVTTSVTSTSPTTSVASTSTTNPGTCNGQAYDPNLYTCATNDQGRPVLCPKGYGACGSACYSPSGYCCQNGALRPAGQCGSGATCAGVSYNPSTSYCCTSIPDRQTNTVCPIGQHCCSGILNGTNYYGPGSLYTGCYNPSTNKCCYGGTSAFLNPSTIESNGYTVPSGAVRFCQN